MPLAERAGRQWPELPEPSTPEYALGWDPAVKLAVEQFENQIVRHLEKADYVPVDVSDFNLDQVLRIKSFIASLGDRVFLVGE